MMARASGVVAASLLIVYFRLPHGQHTASVQPTAMRLHTGDGEKRLSGGSGRRRAGDGF